MHEANHSVWSPFLPDRISTRVKSGWCKFKSSLNQLNGRSYEQCRTEIEGGRKRYRCPSVNMDGDVAAKFCACLALMPSVTHLILMIIMNQSLHANFKGFQFFSKPLMGLIFKVFALPIRSLLPSGVTLPFGHLIPTESAGRAQSVTIT